MNIINPLVEEYLKEFYTPACKTLGEIRTNAEKLYIPIITRDVERLLAVVLQSLEPKRILEIGTAIGYSSAFMAATNDYCRIDTIENNQKSYEDALENLVKLGLENRINVILGDATAVMDRLIAAKPTSPSGTYDMVFIDASKSRYKGFFNQAMALTRVGGLIICDNVLMRGTVANDCYDPEGKHKTSVKNMRSFLHNITNRDDVETGILPIGDGISMSTKLK